MQMTKIDHGSRNCMRVSELLGRIGDRWTLPVVVTLNGGPLRFNAIRRAITGISQQMLTRTLRALERDGMVSRTVHPSVPPQVEYALTPLGLSLAEEAARLGRWMQTHLAEIDGHRAAFDNRTAN
ncbi:winged helix-turn-helix transcriptional regulator [Sphingomonas colocasiae]|uniref:Helix-turn-helix transcriptional regulator n=1 Tax=Sphingomonas colocasiae TaxID=1848973 RepID=A0ABS7PZA7_9SPHN|nr:helix-turn-helix domain-containing protein [Sphingomonas colocasiae]MBY8826279.1 helix-turn-helix transcriptional regulator [Sphingomonas colocasiae]